MTNDVRKRDPDAERGMGRERFERILKTRPSKKLKDGDHLLFHHALRCMCHHCGRLLDWDCPADISYIITECCGVQYRLMPWTVKVETEDVSSRPILPKMQGSNYSDPESDLSKQMVGELKTIETRYTKPLSAAQLRQGAPFPKPSETIQEPRVIVVPAKKKEPVSPAAGFIMPAGRPQVPVAPVVKKPDPPRARRVRKCSICREPGHNKRKCPEA